jgi:hypothetical protein
VQEPCSHEVVCAPCSAARWPKNTALEGGVLNSERAITAPRPRPSSPLGHTTGHEYTATAKNETSQPTGRRKAGFEVWVPIKGGLDLSS